MSRLHQTMVFGSTRNQGLPALSFGESSKPGLSFPLGTGLVVLIILFVSALFSFCYHWLRLRKLGHSFLLPTHGTAAAFTLQAPPTLLCTDNCKPPTTCMLGMLQCPPVVYMAGEDMPRFIAMPCAFEGASHKANTDDALHKTAPKSIDDLELDVRL